MLRSASASDHFHMRQRADSWSNVWMTNRYLSLASDGSQFALTTETDDAPITSNQTTKRQIACATSGRLTTVPASHHLCTHNSSGAYSEAPCDPHNRCASHAQHTQACMALTTWATDASHCHCHCHATTLPADASPTNPWLTLEYGESSSMTFRLPTSATEEAVFTCTWCWACLPAASATNAFMVHTA